MYIFSVHWQDRGRITHRFELIFLVHLLFFYQSCQQAQVPLDGLSAGRVWRLDDPLGRPPWVGFFPTLISLEDILQFPEEELGAQTPRPLFLPRVWAQGGPIELPCRYLQSFFAAHTSIID